MDAAILIQLPDLLLYPYYHLKTLPGIFLYFLILSWCPWYLMLDMWTYTAFKKYKYNAYFSVNITKYHFGERSIDMFVFVSQQPNKFFSIW